jgi:hypothetical protein
LLPASVPDASSSISRVLSDTSVNLGGTIGFFEPPQL